MTTSGCCSYAGLRDLQNVHPCHTQLGTSVPMELPSIGGIVDPSQHSQNCYLVFIRTGLLTIHTFIRLAVKTIQSLNWLDFGVSNILAVHQSTNLLTGRSVVRTRPLPLDFPCLGLGNLAVSQPSCFLRIINAEARRMAFGRNNPPSIDELITLHRVKESQRRPNNDLAAKCESYYQQTQPRWSLSSSWMGTERRATSMASDIIRHGPVAPSMTLVHQSCCLQCIAYFLICSVKIPLSLGFTHQLYHLPPPMRNYSRPFPQVIGKRNYGSCDLFTACAQFLQLMVTWRAKFRAIQQQRIKTDDIDQVLESTAASQKADQLTAATGAAALARGPRPGLAGEQQTIIRIDDTTHVQPFTDGSIPRTALAADEVAVRPIIARERRWRTRVTVLQSQGKTFYENIVLGILRNVIVAKVHLSSSSSRLILLAAPPCSFCNMSFKTARFGSLTQYDSKWHNAARRQVKRQYSSAGENPVQSCHASYSNALPMCTFFEQINRALGNQNY
ncbi:hypothetical protein T265_08010 [Opisthorchis viverrini]|uniref:Paf1 complex subunit Cdc73 N-terminal domain-containing protein n=1 Tax=Opisthorchis viverrini TaxID=6198 RepID=A0A075A9R3_OPIVI|nr:hypothetical protein T265_08010 [Opisthorchis viverrini]KER24269.1 hypothetical protein T265_08010 [Opisthorchis viverrini]